MAYTCHLVEKWHTPGVSDAELEQPPPVSLREENRRRARQRIIDTTVDLVRETGHATFTMSDVASRSGVGLRTLYRYFPKREDLVGALASVADQSDALAPPQSIDELEEWLVQAWRNLLDEEALLRAQHLGAAGAEVRRRRIPQHRALTLALLRSFRPDLADDVLIDIVDVALVVTSSTAMFEFIDVLDITTERGAYLAARTVRILLEAA